MAFPCDGTQRERQVLREQSGTWIINQTRAFATGVGRAVYCIPVGKARLERVKIKVNFVACSMEFSADGTHWDTLLTKTNIQANPGQFITEEIEFSEAQRKAASASGNAWFRFTPAAKSIGETLQLQFFRLEIRGAEAPPGFVRSSWWQPFVPSLPGLLMGVVGVVPILFVWRKWHIPWRIWGTGAALWAIAVALKSALAMIASVPVYRWLHSTLPPKWADPAYWGYGGVLTGIFECGIFLAIAPLLRRKQWAWREAVSLGVGFGAAEALALAAAASIWASQAAAWGNVSSWSEATVPAFERLLALLIHIATVVMMMRAVTAREWGWFWSGFAFKSAVDAVAAWYLLEGTPRLRSSLWLMEWTCFVPFALLSLFVLANLKHRWAKPPPKPS